MPKIDLESIESVSRTTYPMPFAAEMGGRSFRRLAPAAGITDFGASHVVLKPGGISSQRHWHEAEDELVIMISGEAVLVEEGSETVMRAGDCAAFPKGKANGHHFVNHGDADCIFVAIGGPPVVGKCYYPDIDLVWDGPNGCYTHRDGTPYATGVS